MKIESRRFRQLAVNFFSIFRKIYSPILFQFLWIFKIRRTLTKETQEKLKEVYRGAYDLGYADFVTFMKETTKWLPEKLNGTIDFTYRYKWLNFSEKTVTEWGRDCDDVSRLWYDYLKSKGWEEVYSIMCMAKDTSTAHIFTVGKRIKGEPFFVYDNTRGPFGYDEAHIIKAVEAHLVTRESWNPERYDDTVWSFYRIFTNISK